MMYSIVFDDESRTSGNAKCFEDIKLMTKALHAVNPIKFVTVCFDDVEGGIFSEKEND